MLSESTPDLPALPALRLAVTMSLAPGDAGNYPPGINPTAPTAASINSETTLTAFNSGVCQDVAGCGRKTCTSSLEHEDPTLTL